MNDGLISLEKRKREEAERVRAEEKEKNDSVVIAVATKDISLLTRNAPQNTTRGRLIHDINNTSEFKKPPFDITIHYQPRTPTNPCFDISTKTLPLLDYTRNGRAGGYHIIYNNSYYWPRNPITRGTQNFQIFTMY